MPKLNSKYIEWIHNFLSEQNRQLLQIIAEKEGLDFEELANRYLTPRSKFYQDLTKIASAQK